MNENLSESMRFRDKVVLVTGASRGIGSACVRRFANEGAKVVIHYLKAVNAAEDLAKSIRDEGGQVTLIQANLAEPPQIEHLIDSTVKTFGGLDILVNNAGIATVGSLDAVEPESFHHQFALNVGSVLFATKAAVKAFKISGGSIVNISSINGSRPVAGASVYSASKAAVDALTKSLAIELAPRRIRVNAVAPGTTDTDLLRSVLAPELEAGIVEHTLYGRRLGQPADIAEVVAFLASTEAEWITGQIINASGGLQI
jgi:3-oxoacyl-[acyl-carrier protein] reductase